MSQAGIDEHRDLCNSGDRRGSIALNDLVGPAATPTKRVIAYLEQEIDRLRPAMKPEFRDREIYVSVVRSRKINAGAAPSKSADHIVINSELIERLFGMANAVFATTQFLADVGDSSAEIDEHGVKRVVLPKRATDYSIPITDEAVAPFLPTCQYRRLAAEQIAFRGLRFCALHELGHIVARHRPIPEESTWSRFIGESELDGLIDGIAQVFVEHDADTFAGMTLRNLASTQNQVSSLGSELRWLHVDPRYLEAVLDVLGVLLLYKLLNSIDSIPSKVDINAYPPDMARAFNACILIELGIRERNEEPDRTENDIGTIAAQNDLLNANNWFGLVDGKTLKEAASKLDRKTVSQMQIWENAANYVVRLTEGYKRELPNFRAKDRLTMDWRPPYASDSSVENVPGDVTLLFERFRALLARLLSVFRRDRPNGS